MNAPIRLTVLRRSGVCGPTQAGSSSLRLISITRSKICSRAASTSSSARKCSACSRASAAISARSVLSRYAAVRSSNGNSEVVAPISAPMLVIVPRPVALSEATPGPKYSTIAPVPPFTVSSAATRMITSLGAVQPSSAPLRWTPISRGIVTPQPIPAITSTASAPPTPIATIPRPPALGVWLSVPIIIPPGKA